jgi:hypothetical protein
MGEHINTFSKGMTSDMNILMQPDGTYRYMRNCSLISQDGNNFVVKDCLGNTLIFELNIPYFDYDDTDPGNWTYETYPMAIGFISFPNKLIVLHTNSDVDGGGYGEIGVLNYTTYGEGITPITITGSENNGYVPLYGHIDLKFSKMHRIDGFAYEENDAVQRIYWTDNKNEPRSLNVADPIFSTYIPSGSLVVGKQYMILEGIIEHPVASTAYYGPSNIGSNVFGNIFTASSTTYTDITTPNPDAKVIDYYPIQLLAFTPSRSMGNIKFKEYGAGSVYCGSKIYFYRLTSPIGGIKTSWSYGSSPIHVGTENSPVSVPTNAYFDFAGGGSTTALLNSGRSVFITIDNIDQSFTNIEVAVAEFDQIVETPKIISIISSTPITGDSMDIEHAGSSNLGELTLDDVTLFPASILTCKTLTTNKNYNLIGNTTERTEFTDFDNLTVSISQIRHKMPVHPSENGAHIPGGQFCDNILSYDSVSPNTAANPALVDGIEPYTQWVVTLGVATYNAVAYGPAQAAGQVFQGVLGVYNWTDTSGTAVVRPCVSRNKYTTFSGSRRKPDWIQFNINNSNDRSYKNPAVASHVKGLWSNQTYRYGMCFFDLKGNPFYVRWLGDFTTDTIVNNPLMENVQINSGGDHNWYINQNGVNIDGITIPPTIIDKISGFSVVRAERDATIMSQGMLMQVGASALPGSGVVYPLPSPNVNNSDTAYAFHRGQIYTLVCPDKLVDYPVSNYAVGSNISTSHWLKARNLFGYNMTSSIDGDEAMETKYFEELAAETNVDPDRNYRITSLINISENEAVPNFGASSDNFMNQVQFTGGPTNPTDGICYSIFPPNLESCPATGGMRTLLEVDGSVWAYNKYAAIFYYNLNSGFTEVDYKMMVNVTVNKSNLYGGQNDAALANTFYISTGHFQPITTAVKADVFDGANYVFNNVEVWGGDCFTCLIDYGHSLYNATLPFGVAYQSHSWGIKFACQCNSNYDLRRGRTVANNRMYPATTGVSYDPAQLEGFSYNKGYSTQGLEFEYPALPVNHLSAGQFKFRVRFAGQKFPGETTDSFRIFNINDYKDTDGQGGEINNLKTKDGRTVVWQNKIINTVPLLERQLMPGTTGGALNIGTGGVVDRFDPINSYFGNQHQWGLTETEYGFAWFDMRRKAFVTLDLGSGITEVSNVDGLKGFFDEIFLEVIGNTSSDDNLINSQTFDPSSDRPLLGVGVTGAYDPKFKMTYLTFKFYSREDFSDGRGSEIKNITKDFTLGYYHPQKQFVGFYDWTPCISHTHGQTLFSVKNPQCKTVYYGPNMTGADFIVGDIVGYLNAEYMCIYPVTINMYPGNVTQVPDYPGSTYWARINSTNQIWAHNQPIVIFQNPAPGYQYNMFFGQVVDNELWFVINPKTGNPFNVLDMEQHGNNQNITSLYTSTSTQTASDVSISATSRFYRRIYNFIASSMPLSSAGRITDSFLLVKFIKKNWTSSPLTLSVGVKILQYVKSHFQEKR